MVQGPSRVEGSRLRTWRGLENPRDQQAVLKADPPPASPYHAPLGPLGFENLLECVVGGWFGTMQAARVPLVLPPPPC